MTTHLDRRHHLSCGRCEVGDAILEPGADAALVDCPRCLHHDNAAQPDNVNQPAHYTAGSVECIDAIEAALTSEEFRGYCKGNVLKYVWRERHKGGDESLAKAAYYLARLKK